MKSIANNNHVLRGSILVASFLPGWALAANNGGSGDCSNPGSADITTGANCAQPNKTPNTLFGNGGIFQTIANILIFLIGAISVIMLIIGGFRYVISAGNESHVKGAKDTILYAVIGIIVAILAYAIVGFVTGSLTQNT